MQHVTAILSMLHESASAHPDGSKSRLQLNSATRTFRDEPVLAWTLERLSRANRLTNMAILCWEDQLEAVTPIAEEHSAYVLSKDPRITLPAMEAVTAARKWADGWRGGLLGACDFDLGFHTEWIRELIGEIASDAVILVDPSAGLVDPMLIDRVIEHAEARDSVQICFTQAAPGLAGVLIKPGLLDQLASAHLHPGTILSYLPDQPVRDPISGEGCVPVPASIARTTHSFKLDSDRQIARITEAALNLNGQLLTSDAEGLLHRLEWGRQVDPLPREIVLELNAGRLSSPMYWPGRHHRLDRADMKPQVAARMIEDLAQADDARLTIGGVGDPLLHDGFLEILKIAQRAGIHAIHVETDLLIDEPAMIDRLVDSGIDVVSVQLPAVTPQTYQAVMGVDGITRVLENIRRFVTHRQQAGRGVPLIVPVFTKCRQNLAEMESWYDQWLKALGCAVICGPSSFAGQTPDFAVADMSSPKRRGCARVGSRLTVLGDGRAVSCEQDPFGKQVVGDLRFDSLAVVWNDGMQALRQAHQCGSFEKLPLCAACREWHRP